MTEQQLSFLPPIPRLVVDNTPRAKPYRPSNGTEGACFHEAWCGTCQRDAAMRGDKDFDDCDDNEKCQIIADTFAYDVDDPKYPKEWVYDAHGNPCCTAYQEYTGPERKDTARRYLDEVSGIVA